MRADSLLLVARIQRRQRYVLEPPIAHGTFELSWVKSWPRGRVTTNHRPIPSPDPILARNQCCVLSAMRWDGPVEYQG